VLPTTGCWNEGEKTGSLSLSLFFLSGLCAYLRLFMLGENATPADAKLRAPALAFRCLQISLFSHAICINRRYEVHAEQRELHQSVRDGWRTRRR
jgi:hypothetical protein